MSAIPEISEMLELSNGDPVTVLFYYKKEAEVVGRFFISNGYDCTIKAKEFSNRNYIYFLTIKKQKNET